MKATMLKIKYTIYYVGIAVWYRLRRYAAMLKKRIFPSKTKND